MERRYQEIPDNFDRIQEYVITNKEEIAYEIITAEKCFFYDTCAFRNHMLISKPECLFEYIRQMNGIVVIIRSIIMELCSGDNLLWEEHIAYIEKMHQYGIKILILYEEDVYCVLSACYSGTAVVNKMLSFAVRNVKMKTGVIEDVLNVDKLLRKEILFNQENYNRLLTAHFFEKMRAQKSSGDDLGETMIAVCVHMLSNIREVQESKYLILTDDKRAITLLGKVMKNTEEYIGKKCITVITTPKFCWLLLERHINENIEQIEDVLEHCSTNGEIRLYCSEKFELSPRNVTMNSTVCAKKLVEDDGFKVYL